MPDDTPRRRISDKERRRWSDHSLDLLKEDVDELKRFYAVLSHVPGLMQGLQDAVEEARKDIRELRAEDRANFERNFREHKAVQQKTAQIAKHVEPSRWSKAKDFAALVSMLLVPVLAAWVAAGR